MTDPIKESLVAAAGIDFDQLRRKPMFVPAFIFQDGTLGQLEGTCRGFGSVGGDEAESEFTIGIYTPTGHYFNIMLDSRVRSAVPTFFIGDEPYYLPIVRCLTMAAGLPVIDPATGIMRRPEDMP
jgi:hypothetical protein